MPKFWMSEACDLAPDPESGVLITRLTSAVMSNINIYGEQPYTTRDGNRIAIMRSPYADPRLPPYDLCVIDLRTYKLLPIDQGCTSSFIATAAWSGVLFYLNSSRQLVRYSLDTLERSVVLRDWPMPDNFTLQSASPDERYLIGVINDENFMAAIVRVDLRDGTWKKIFEHNEVVSHLQFNPVNGRDILVQINCGAQLNHLHDMRLLKNGPGKVCATHVIISADGGNLRKLPIGEPITCSSSGHSAWVADTGRMGFSTHFNDMAHAGPLDKRFPEGNFFTAGPGEKKPRVFPSPSHRFNHVSISRCGRYFVCDSYLYGIPGRIPLVIGNIKTGKCRAVISNCGAQGGGPACSHPHPYLTADNRHVIYNADPMGICHVHKGLIPDEFYESLE